MDHGRVIVEAPDGLLLSVRVAGRGAPLMLLHGFTGTADAWGEPLLASLAERYRVVAPDLIGHGASARPHEARRYALECVLDDLAAVQAVLLDGPAVWIGYSMGARVALAAAARRTAPLRALVLESGSPGLAGGEQRQARRRADSARAAALERDGIEAFVDAWLAQPLFRSQRALPESTRRAERERRLAQDPRALAACLRGLGTGAQPSFWAELGRIAVPTLLVTGRRDRKFDALAEAMAERLPAARRSRIAGAGHAVHLERPDAWLAAVAAFLERTLPAEP